MKRFRIDLHIHTALSACAEEEMSPENIVNMALLEGLSLIAITDHNNGANCLAVQRAAPKELTVLAGIEVETREEVHVLTLLPGRERFAYWCEKIHNNLPQVPHNARIFGHQTVFSPRGDYPWLLGQATTMSLEDVCGGCRELGGIVVCAHVFRTSGLVRQLGFVPRALPVDAVEVQYGAQATEPTVAARTILINSDAHSLSELVRPPQEQTWMEAEAATFSELQLALSASNGRKVVIGKPCDK